MDQYARHIGEAGHQVRLDALGRVVQRGKRQIAPAMDVSYDGERTPCVRDDDFMRVKDIGFIARDLT